MVSHLDLVAASVLSIGADAKAARLFRTLGAGAGPEDLARLLGVPNEDLAGQVELARKRATELVARGRAVGIEAVPIGDARYPSWLAQIVDPPIVLWARGDVSIVNRASVAVVGSRRPSASSVTFAERIAAGLARAGLVVTSGLALGVDGAAHRGALSVGGLTVAVLGSGLDVVYPRQHGGLADEVARNGCLLSELPPGIGPEPHHFPLRNRVISGLSRAVVVVEAAERSGSLITARMALEQGRAVCAVPGSVVSGCHKGCHALIKDGARLVETVEDVLDELQWTPASAPWDEAAKSLFSNVLLDEMTPGRPMAVDELANRRPASAAGILAELTALELAGRVRRLPGGWFVRLD